MTLDSFIRAMPKVELHVHLEGSIRPETLLTLSRRHNARLPADSVEGLRQWYTFTDFPHFVEVYVAMSRCLKTADDIEWITREFLVGQAEQNIIHSEATYTAYTLWQLHRLPFEDQLAAINRAREWAKETLGVTMTLTIDIAREVRPEDGMITAEWAISGLGRGVTGFGLGGNEVGNPPEKHAKAFERARAAGLASVPHAGETVGPESVWGALRSLKAVRLGHGVRSIEDLALIDELRARQIPLEVCPTSNVRLKVAPALAEHPLPKLIDSGVCVTINSDDPPMFNTTLTDEWLQLARTFGWGLDMIYALSRNAVKAALLNGEEKAALERRFDEEWRRAKLENQ
ncbi:MAG: adenosine deaminase [Chloroflexi bacterium]|nr:adenosine deaminase [Chloroflexota bacterium]